MKIELQDQLKASNGAAILCRDKARYRLCTVGIWRRIEADFQLKIVYVSQVLKLFPFNSENDPAPTTICNSISGVLVPFLCLKQYLSAPWQVMRCRRSPFQFFNNSIVS